MRKLMTVLLLVAAIIVGYLSVMSILTPERFTKTRIAREAPIQVRLKEVAHVENAFHDPSGLALLKHSCKGGTRVSRTETEYRVQRKNHCGEYR